MNQVELSIEMKAARATAATTPRTAAPRREQGLSQALDRIGIDGVDHAAGSGPAHYKPNAYVFFESNAAIFLFCRKTPPTRLIRHAHRFFYWRRNDREISQGS